MKLILLRPYSQLQNPWLGTKTITRQINLPSYASCPLSGPVWAPQAGTPDYFPEVSGKHLCMNACGGCKKHYGSKTRTDEHVDPKSRAQVPHGQWGRW